MAIAPLGQMIVEMGLDDARFRTSVQGIKTELKYMESSFKNSKSLVEQFGKGVSGAVNPTKQLSEMIQAQKSYLAILIPAQAGVILIRFRRSQAEWLVVVRCAV
jgi:hypothetical protein